MIDFILPLFGRFHPLFVHLPIGILFLAVLLSVLPSKEKATYIPAIRISLFVGAFFAFLSCISGFLQYQNEGYTWETVQFHLILGWATAIASLLLFFDFKKIKEIQNTTKWKMGGLFLILTITGHLGGNITHGDDYFLEILPPEIQAIAGYEMESATGLVLPTQGWEELAYFDEVVQPILNQNCKSCHNPKNLKGELDLSNYQSLSLGGEDGLILAHGNASDSELFARLILPDEDENHMPPSEKRQPKAEEIELIRLWIDAGGNQDLKLGDANIDPKTLNPFFIREEKLFFPEIEIPALSENILDSLRARQFYAEPIAANSNWIEISAVNFSGFANSDFPLLTRARGNIVSMDLSETSISDAALDSLRDFPYLTILKLNNTGLTGQGLAALSKCQNLKLLYLNGIPLSADDIQALQNHPALEKVYLFNSSIDPIPENLSFKIEKGSYSLPLVPSDTVDYLKD